MRDATAAADCPLLRWSHLLLLAVGCVCSRTTGAFPMHSTNPLFEFSDQVRLKHLYSDNEYTSVHLRIGPEGVVSGSQDQTVYTVLEIKAVKPGILMILGKKSQQYLCMDWSGSLYGSKAYNEDDCNFREVSLSDGYNLYFSEKHRAPLTLQAAKGVPLTLFQPRINQIPLEWLYEEADPSEGQMERKVKVNSPDPLGMQTDIFFSSSLE